MSTSQGTYTLAHVKQLRIILFLYIFYYFHMILILFFSVIQRTKKLFLLVFLVFLVQFLVQFLFPLTTHLSPQVIRLHRKIKTI